MLRGATNGQPEAHWGSGLLERLRTGPLVAPRKYSVRSLVAPAAFAALRSYQPTQALPRVTHDQGMNRRADELPLKVAGPPKLAPLLVDSRVTTRSPPLPSFSAKVTKTRATFPGSGATVGLLSVLPSLQRSRPGIGQVTPPLSVATVTGKPVAGVRPVAQELKRFNSTLLPLRLTT